MSDDNQNPQAVDPDAEGAGFAPESDDAVVQHQPQPIRRRQKSDEMRKNFKAVFGHGIGKISLVAAASVILIGAALGYRGLTSKPAAERLAKSEIEVPSAPMPRVDVDAVSEHEAKRRAERAALEAEEAAAKGQTYQPGFDTHIVKPVARQVDPNTEFNLRIVGADTPPMPDGTMLDGTTSEMLRQPADTPPTTINVPPGQQAGARSGSSPTTPTTITVPAGQQPKQAAAQQSQAAAQAEAQARQKLELELKQAQADRDKYVNAQREQIMKQIALMFGESGQGGLNAQGAYSTIGYYPVSLQDGLGGVGGDPSRKKVQAGPGLNLKDDDDQPNRGTGKLLIKTGKMLYATLDSEMNTDDGNDVIATIRGGDWDGSKIIGQVEKTPNNVRLRFSTMAPQDSRPTMRISAIALREEDAKQGIAENIDYHILERYGSLAVASLLSGYGRAYSQTMGTTVITPGGTVATTNQEPSTRQANAMALGEVGQRMATQIQQNFNRPTTYSTPAQTGFGLFFMQDVYEQRK